MPKLARWGAIAVVAAATLSGCAMNSDYPILDRSRIDSDAVPESVSEVLDMSQFDLESSRLSATHDDVQYFLIEYESSSGVGLPCLLVAGRSPVIACGGGGPVTVGGAADKAQLVPAPALSGDGWTAISENVHIPSD